jgi:hypothetical protein
MFVQMVELYVLIFFPPARKKTPPGIEGPTQQV